MFKGSDSIYTHIKQGKKKINIKVDNIKKGKKSGQGEKEPGNSKAIAMETSWNQLEGSELQS